ncbi:MAG: hypothetical protein ACI8Z1_001799, partial [Candidatus Azotimanducaceae bacterium]
MNYQKGRFEMIEETVSSTQSPAEFREHYEKTRDSLIMMVDDEPIVMGVIQAF